MGKSNNTTARNDIGGDARFEGGTIPRKEELLELVLEVQQEEARPYEDDGRPNLIEITCVYCRGCCRIYARASDNEQTYARACQAVKLWVMCHKHCLPMRRIPGLAITLRKEVIQWSGRT